MLLFRLALKPHKNGHQDIWFWPVPTFDWFGRGSKKAGKLPAPVTQHRSRSKCRSQSKPSAAAAPPRRQVSVRHTRGPRPPQGRQPHMAYIPPKQRPARTRTTDRYRPDYYRRVQRNGLRLLSDLVKTWEMGVSFNTSPATQ